MPELGVYECPYTGEGCPVNCATALRKVIDQGDINNALQDGLRVLNGFTVGAGQTEGRSYGSIVVCKAALCTPAADDVVAKFNRYKALENV